MRKTGSALAAWCLLASATAIAAGGETSFDMTADRTKVGVEDTFRVEVVVTNGPPGASIQFPSSKDFEVLSRSESTQMSYSLGGGAASIQQVRRYTLAVRARRTGTVVIPPAQLQAGSETLRTESIRVEVVPGSLEPEERAARRGAMPNPFGFPPGMDPFGDLEGSDPFSGFFPPRPRPPRGDSDLFLRAAVDRTEVYVNEQVLMSLLLYARVPVASVDGVSMPKYQGFWTHELKTAKDITAERREVDGIEYNVYVLRRKVLFPMQPGTVTIEAAEAELATGNLWATHRVRRKSNEISLTVKPLPPGGRTSVVGQWRLGAQLSQTTVPVGDPVQLKLVLQGRGNLEAARLPAPELPPGVRVLEPELKDRSELVRGSLTGVRTVEYVLVPQQTGTVSIPALAFPYFNPETQRYEEARTDPLTLSVVPGASGQTSVGAPGIASSPSAAASGAGKNELVNTGLRPLRHSARLVPPSPPFWGRSFFAPAVAAPPAAVLLWALGGGLSSLLRRDSDASRKGRQARAARARLKGARKLLERGAAADFYAEVERALRSFLEAKLGCAIGGLTRVELEALLDARQVPPAETARLLAVFDTCDLGRYAPGMGEHAARQKTLDDAGAAMEAFS